MRVLAVSLQRKRRRQGKPYKRSKFIKRTYNCTVCGDELAKQPEGNLYLCDGCEQESDARINREIKRRGL